jgi:hypothetical protein
VQPKKVDPVKLFAGILYSDSELMKQSLCLLEGRFGKIDYRSSDFDFVISDYYVSEMGKPIKRIFVSFESLISPKDISYIKIETNEIEERLSVNGKRKVNIDCGYIDCDKVVLASAKYNGQKIYLDHGIWADLTLHYEKGKFDAYPWSFPDFKQGIYDKVFLEIRVRFKQQRKKN